MEFQLTEVEDASMIRVCGRSFITKKTGPGHISLFVRTLQQWMKTSLRRESCKSLDVLLAAKDRAIMATASPVRVLLQRMKVPVPGKPGIVENAVQKNTSRQVELPVIA